MSFLGAWLTALTLAGAPAQAGIPGVVPAPPTSLDVVDWVLWDLSSAYVDPHRFDPMAMTVSAIEALESEIPEVVVSVASPDGKGRRVATVEVAGQRKDFTLEVQGIWSIAPALREVMAFVEKSTHLEPQARDDAEYAMIDGFLARLDPHTNLLRPSAFEDLSTSTAGEFGGLGIEIGMRDGMVTVLRVLDGNPADEAGMEEGDRIVQINDESAVAMPTDEVVQRLRGQRGTYVDVYVRREGVTRPIKFTIRRDTIKLESLTGDVIEGKRADGSAAPIGVIVIPRNFSQTTGRELREELAEFEKAGVEGIVLDMRHNPGGLMQAAVEVSDAFLSAGTIVSMVGAHQPREEDRADSRYDFRDVPIVVLVDQSSASATEIVTGALRNHDRAVVMGRRTFGKGSVQVLHPWRIGGDDYALKVTIAQYLTPGDVSIQGVGVSPDLETVPVFIGEKYSSWYGRERFDRLREESLDSSLTNQRASRPAAASPTLYYLAPGSVGERDDEDKPLTQVKGEKARADRLLSDAEIRLAREFLLWAPSSDRGRLVAQLDDFVELQRKAEEARITKSLGKKKIDWAAGEAPTGGKAAKLAVDLAIDAKQGRIAAGKTGTITVTVTNNGDAPAYRVRAMSDSDYAYFDERELFFGRIDPGQSRKATLELSVDEHELSRSDRIAFAVHDQHDSPLAGERPFLDVHGIGDARPRLGYTVQIIDDMRVSGVTGNGDGALQIGEKVRLRVEVENLGQGVSRDTLVQLTNASGEALFLRNARAKLGELAPGASAVAELEFDLKQMPEGRSADMDLLVADVKMGDAIEDRLRLPIFDANRTKTPVPMPKAGIETTAETAVYDTAVGGIQRHIATAPAGTSFAAHQRVGDWIQVDLGAERFGYISARQTREARRPRKAPTIAMHRGVEPPQIELDAVPSMVDGDSVVIRGRTRHPERLRDLYASVYNPSRDLFGAGDKVFYARPSAKDPAVIEFEFTVPLEPGNNLVALTSRHDEHVKESARVWVLRTKGLAELREAEALAKAGR